MDQNSRDRFRIVFCVACAFLVGSLMRDGCLPPPPAYSPEEADQPIPEMQPHQMHALDDNPARMFLRPQQGK